MPRLLCTLATAVALTACSAAGPAPRTATFRGRPDDVVAGDLRGPFTGRVVDGANGSPVPGALVYAAWTFVRGDGLTVAAGAKDAVVSTDATGTYQIPALTADGPDGIPAGARLADFRLLIYKRGFVAYRSDRRFADFGQRHDFAQRDNFVELERWRPDHSHARHLRFVGGGGVIAAVTGWETDEAIAELGRPRPTLGPTGTGPYLVAAQLLTEADIKSRTDYDGQFESGPLGDEPDTATYSSQHYKALGRDQTWDVAVRMWRLAGAAGSDRYDELRLGLPGADERDEIADKSLRAIENDIFAVAFYDAERGLVVLLTCGRGQCPNLDKTVDLGQTMHRRIRELWPAPRTGGAP
ncbi:MAG: carboxypeptidase regulatory-like domain-containing protein [Kofleriaceae bacterium]|nr:carboxypeptidase regulatory-like domain-containing protein [Kofleriaceae bacterium]MBP9168927.1 carboxypeptidase regulatory-like domain-containing protein [Kofleriaceae bacterium]MBP9859636.1 carboxypeptidase regulatory-like domain-containing protein [Kofleriaceae bacterium]